MRGRSVRDPRWPVATTLLLALACSDTGGEAGAGDGDDEPDAPDLPEFVEPVGGELELGTAALVDLRLAVAEIDESTTLLIDGIAVGGLAAPSAIGQLDADELLLRIDGGMTAFTHTLQLSRPKGDEPLLSNEVLVILRAERKDFALTSGPPLEISGQSLRALGRGAGSILAVIDTTSDPPLATLLRAEAGTWAAQEVHAVALPELAAPSPSLPPAAAPPLAFAVDRDDPSLVRLAWTTAAHERVAGLELDWDDGGTAASTLLSVAEIELPGIEWQRLATPLLIEDELLVELAAFVDVEHPFPGERRLVARSIGDDPLGVIRVQTSAEDLELLDPILDPTRADLDLRPAVAVRLGGRRVHALELDRGTGDLSLPDGPALMVPSLAGDFAGIVTVAGAFGSRTVVGVDLEGALHGYLASTISMQLEIPPSSEVDLPSDPPSGAPALGLVGGTPVVLIPYGSAAALRLVASDGEALHGGAVADYYCDAVALPATTAAVPEASEQTLGFACLADGALRLGTITASPSEDEADG